jgi:hypothetical protein
MFPHNKTATELGGFARTWMISSAVNSLCPAVMTMLRHITWYLYALLSRQCCHITWYLYALLSRQCYVTLRDTFMPYCHDNVTSHYVIPLCPTVTTMLCYIMWYLYALLSRQCYVTLRDTFTPYCHNNVMSHYVIPSGENSHWQREE